MQITSGAIRSPKDKRDYKWSNVAMAFEPFDWSKGYDIETIRGKFKIKDQNGSGSCGGQAWAYYAYALDIDDSKEKSAAFIYHQTRIDPAGSAGRTNCNLCVNTGVADEEVCSSYDNGLPPTEEYMKTLKISDEAFLSAKFNKTLKYASVGLDIDTVAQAIKENKGCVLGVCGENNGTWRTAFPKAPTSALTSWRHWLYAGKVKMINGKKYIGVINSWGNVGDNGWQWLGEDYFTKSWMIWEVWTMTTLPVEKYKFLKDMKFGDKNNDVKELQKRLGVIQTGFFGTLTLRAVKKWQKEHNLIPDGIVGPLTKASLNNV